MKTIQDAFREIGQTFLRLADEMSPKKMQEQAEEKPATLEAVRNALRELSLSKKAERMRALLSRFGAKRLSDVTPDRYDELLAAAKEAMK